MIKKLTSAEKKQLRFLVEGYLEIETSVISTKIADNAHLAEQIWQNLEATLFHDIFWMDELDAHEKESIDKVTLILGYHEILKPVWQDFKKALFDYKSKIIPQRKMLRKERDTLNKFDSQPFAEFKDLLKQDMALDLEKFYHLPLTLTVSFDPGHVVFYRRSMNVLNNFMDLLSGVEITYFAKCQHCGKCIVISRADKKFCPGCAAKKYQENKWREDPEGMKAKEKHRYRRRRRKS